MGFEQVEAGIHIIAFDFDIDLRVRPSIPVKSDAVVIVFRTEIEMDNIAVAHKFGSEIRRLEMQHIKHGLYLIDSGLCLLKAFYHFLFLLFGEVFVVHHQQHFPCFAVGKIIDLEAAHFFLLAGGQHKDHS